MTVLLWILGILLALFLIVCALPFGGTLYLGERARFVLQIGPFHLDLTENAPAETEEQETAEQKEKTKKKQRANDLNRALPKLSLGDIRKTYQMLWPPTKRALAHTFRSIRIKPLRLFLVLGGMEPDLLAEVYGWVNAGIWSLMPQLERLLVIPQPSIHTELDFNAKKTSLEGEIGFSIRIGTLVGVGLELLFPFLRWLLHMRKTHRSAASEPPAADTSEKHSTTAA